MISEKGNRLVVREKGPRVNSIYQRNALDRIPEGINEDPGCPSETGRPLGSGRKEKRVNPEESRSSGKV